MQQKISVVNGGFNLSEGSLDTTETENHIVLEDETVRAIHIQEIN